MIVRCAEKRHEFWRRAGDTLGELADGMLELAWPTRCVVCDMPGALVCDSCAEELPFIDHALACPACGAPYGRDACTECWTGQGRIERSFDHAACALEFDEASSRLVTCYKDQGERRIAQLLSRLLATCVSDWESAVCESPELVTYIPATQAALRKRGFDHMQPVACDTARLLEAECIGVLGKSEGADQRELGREDRLANMREALYVPADLVCAVEGKDLLLLDDVFTTGATLDAAALALRQAGAARVDVATVLRVW